MIAGLQSIRQVRLDLSRGLVRGGCLDIGAAREPIGQQRAGNIVPDAEDRAWDGGERREMGGGQATPMLFFVEKLLASFLSMMSGIPGGIFAPSLAVGAGFGSSVGMVLGTSVALAAILGMAGYFAGVVQAPMTAFIIILEMTGDHEAVIPIMAVSMIGYVTSRIVSREPLYHGLSRNFIAAAIRARRAVDKGAAEPDAAR